MLTKLHTSFTAFLFCALSTSAFAQSRLETALQHLNEHYPQEKIYLLRSKSQYISGDDIWYKAFVFDGYQRSNYSTTLHLVLYNAQKQEVLKKFIPLADGEGQGDIHLADSLPEGIYYLRAYTEWMLNAGEEFQYLQEIKVLNPASQMKLSASKNLPWRVTVYPEGGNFIEGINTKVAVRLESAGKLPETWQGYLIDKNKPAEKITSFQSLDPNVGVFSIIPEKNVQYQLVIEDANAKSQTADLPQVSSTGIHMQINLGNGIVHYALRNADPAQAQKPCIVAAIYNNTVVYKANANISASGVSAVISTKTLESGIMQLLVFDSEYRVLAKRLCFINPAKLVDVASGITGEISKSPKEELKLGLPADTSIDHYSLVVLDQSAGNPEEEQNLYSTIWLSSDLPAHKIFRPADYFTKNQKVAALDALMITEQWQRYQWDKILKQEFPEIRYKSQPFISYRGNVTISNQPAANIDLNVIFKFADSSTNVQQIQTDADGKFELNSLIFEDILSVYFQVNEKKINKKNLKVSFESLNPEKPYQRDLPAHGYVLIPRNAADPEDPELLRAKQARENHLFVQTKIKELETVVVKGKKKTNTEILNEQLSTPMYRRNNEIVFDLVNDNKTAINYNNVMQYLNGRAPGLRVVRSGSDWIPYLRNTPAAIYLNETQVDISMVSSLPMSEIAMVKVTRGVFSGTSGVDAQNGGSGAVLIYTHKGETRPPTALVVGLNSSTLRGFDKSNAFSVPDYSDAVQRPLTPDTRDLLYWNPFFINDSGTIELYNNDDAKGIRIIMIAFPKSNLPPVIANEILK